MSCSSYSVTCEYTTTSKYTSSGNFEFWCGWQFCHILLGLLRALVMREWHFLAKLYSFWQLRFLLLNGACMQLIHFNEYKKNMETLAISWNFGKINVDNLVLCTVQYWVLTRQFCKTVNPLLHDQVLFVIIKFVKGLLNLKIGNFWQILIFIQNIFDTWTLSKKIWSCNCRGALRLKHSFSKWISLMSCTFIWIDKKIGL